MKLRLVSALPLLVGAALAACSSGLETPGQAKVGPVATLKSAVNGLDRPEFYDLAFKHSATSNGSDKYFSDQKLELLEPATGAVFVPLRDANGEVLESSDRLSTARATCGVTFISPSFAITAAHCVSDGDIRLTDPVRVEMYRPTAALLSNWTAGTVLVNAKSGHFPNGEPDEDSFLTQPLSQGQGYYVDAYTCHRRSQCWVTWKNNVAYSERHDCPLPAFDSNNEPRFQDIAVLECEGAPGEKYGYLRVADEDDHDKEPLVLYKHEIYDIDDELDDSDPRLGKYQRRDGANLPENLHYWGDHPLRSNQLLPLRSVPWPDGTPRSKTDDPLNCDDTACWTDIPICHGTSGAGMLQASDDDRYELLGPTVNAPGVPYLCLHGLYSRENDAPHPGSLLARYAALNYSQALKEHFADDIRDDCIEHESNGDDSLAGILNAYSCLDGDDGDPDERFTGLTIDGLHQRLRKLLPGGQNALELDGLFETAAQRYRLGFIARTKTQCTGEGYTCPKLHVRVRQGSVVSESVYDFRGYIDQVLPVRRDIFGLGDGPYEVTVEAEDGDFEFSLPTALRDGAPLSFDRMLDRTRLAMMPISGSAGAVTAARFTGDGKQGFGALVHPGERLILNRAALSGADDFTARFTASNYAGLKCGLMATNASVTLQQDCSNGGVHRLLAASQHATASAAFFIEVPSTASGSVLIDDIAIASSQAPDGDGDGIPDGLDTCATTTPALTITHADVTNCGAIDASAEVVLPMPVANCAVASMAGHVISSTNPALTVPRVVSGDRVVLPIGNYVVRWTATNGAGNVVTTDQNVSVRPALLATQSLSIRDFSRVENSAGGYASLGVRGTGLLELGNDTKTGAAYGLGNVRAGHRAEVLGNLVASGTATAESDATIHGSVISRRSTALPPALSLTGITFPNTAGSSFINAGEARVLEPGAYGAVTVNSQGTLVLRPGTYHFRELHVNDAARLIASTSTKVFVKTKMSYRTPFTLDGERLAPIYLGYNGTFELTLEANLDGTVVAPNAAVRQGTATAQAFRGKVHARTIELRNNAKFTCMAGSGL